MNPHQKPVEISKPMWMVIAVVMTVAAFGTYNQQEQQRKQRLQRTVDWRGPFISEDLTVSRHSDSTVDFPQLGIRVTLDDGWSCLTTTDLQDERQPTFVNESFQLFVRIAPFPFKDWPPRLESSSSRENVLLDIKEETSEQKESDETILAESSTSETKIPTESVLYENCEIEWLRLQNQPTPGSQTRLGKLESDSANVLVTVVQMQQRTKQKSDQNAAIQVICDQIQPIAE